MKNYIEGVLSTLEELYDKYKDTAKKKMFQPKQEQEEQEGEIQSGFKFAEYDSVDDIDPDEEYIAVPEKIFEYDFEEFYDFVDTMRTKHKSQVILRKK